MSMASYAHQNVLRLLPLASESDIQRVVALEAASYPSDEAASEHNIRLRQQQAGAFFRVAFLKDGDDDTGKANDDAASSSNESDLLVGFVNGTLSTSRELEEESMHEHDPLGTTLCIHSVVIDAAQRRKGIASQMLRQYVRDVVEQQEQVERIVLIAKVHLVGFYVGCGFAVTRLSSVVHGKDPWFELALDCVAARRLPVVQVDAFTAEIFDGNPAAVVMMPPTRFHKTTAAAWMQRVAMENNLSNTAYVARREGHSGLADVAEFDLRWFTPATEVKLCGHATLSTAFVLWEGGRVLPSLTIHFHTLSGVLTCKLETVASTDGATKQFVCMEFPLSELHPVGVADAADCANDKLAAALGISPASIITVHKTSTKDVQVHIEAAAFESVVPDFQKLIAFDARGVVVTAEGEGGKASGVDFQSRFFAPRLGVNEDPVTGSAHCALANYWSKRLGKTSLYARQACPTRGGFLTLELSSARPDRVVIKGEAVVSLRGVLLTAP